ncbi:Gag-Pol polyprotein [Labeo rohita]|uniref:ribonuclease H n=1 Tax=Labeo rohita TaxID=84645 RepID=A0ABQ8L3E3_LABRO|nr:Gag-Pol polyprotein [Labeo rohita]
MSCSSSATPTVKDEPTHNNAQSKKAASDERRPSRLTLWERVNAPLPPTGREPEGMGSVGQASPTPHSPSSLVKADAPVLRAEIANLQAKDAIKPVPPDDMRTGFYSPYFIVPKKGCGLRLILDLCFLNRALHRPKVQDAHAETHVQVCPSPDWFAVIDLKDTYFNVSILPSHRPFLSVTFEGRAYQYKVLPFGLALSPHVFMKVAEGLGTVEPSGQLGKEQTLPNAETVSEGPGAYGSYSATGAALYETTSTLAPRLSPEMGVAVWHSPIQSDTGLLPNFHPVVRPYISLGRSPPGTVASITGWGAMYNEQVVSGLGRALSYTGTSAA